MQTVILYDNCYAIAIVSIIHSLHFNTALGTVYLVSRSLITYTINRDTDISMSSFLLLNYTLSCSMFSCFMRVKKYFPQVINILFK